MNLQQPTASPSSLAVYAAGTVYSLTNSAAALAFGTTSPTLVINKAGTWLISARVRLDYAGATFAAVRTATLKLRRTNNTAGDLTGATCALKTSIITTLTFSMPNAVIPTVVYTTANTDDSISIFGSLDVVPTAGTLDAVEAEIVATKLS